MKKVVYDIGDHVECDSCGEVHTKEQSSIGGFTFGSRGICSKCMPRWEEEAKKYNEERFIGHRARDGETFYQFVMRIRGGDNKITITSF